MIELKSKNKRKMLYGILGLILFFIALSGVIYSVNYHKKQKEAEKEYVELKKEVVKDQEEPEKEKEEEEEVPKWRVSRTVDFKTLHEKNEDIYSWIEIPGTKVDYPVLQHSEDNGYYLDHTMEHTEGLPGSIYSEKLHAKDYSSKHTVLYGHNMRNDSMFGSLHDYEDPEFFKQYPYIYIYLPEKTLVYQIFAAVNFSNAYLPGYYNYEDQEEFAAFIEELKAAKGNVSEEVSLTSESRLLTLSTCIANQPEQRFLVNALLIDEYEN